MKKCYALLLILSFFTIHLMAADVAAPALSSISPADGDTDVALDANIVLVFDQPVFQGQTSGATLLLINDTDNTSDKSLTPTSAEISGWGTTTLTIDYGTLLYSGLKDYYIYSYNGFFENGSGETYDIPNENAIFTTRESTPPTVSSFNPMHQAEQVAVDADLVITFSEPIKGNTAGGYVRVKRYDSDAQVLGGRPAFETNLFTVTGSTLTIHLSEASGVITDAIYYVTIGANAIEDLAGNDFAGFTDNTTWTFETVDDVGPVIISRFPQHNSTFGSLGSQVNFTFDEDIYEGSGTVSLYNNLNQVIETVTTGVSDSRIEVLTTAHRVHVDFDFVPEEGTQYKVGISADAFEDEYGNGMAALSHLNWAFVTNVRPHLSTQSPTHENISVAVDAAISFSITQDIYIESGAVLNVKEYASDNLVESFDLNTGFLEAGTEITLDPSNDLDSDKQFYVMIEPAGAVSSELNATDFIDLDSKDGWTFWTDLGPPTVTSFSPADDATGVPLDIGKLTMTLSEEVVEGTSGTFRLRYVGTNITVQEFDVGTSEVTISGNTVTLNDVVTLNASSSYWVQNLTYENAVKDLSGKPLADWNDDTVWSFSADDGLAPTITSVTEIEDGVYENYTLRLTVNFSEPVVIDNSFNMFRLGIVSPAVQFNISSNIEQPTPSSITINYEGLRHNWSYYLYIDPLAITDNSGNAFVGVTSNTAYRFLATWDQPGLISRTPDATSQQPVDSDIVLEFDEDVLVNGGFPDGVNAFRLIRISDNSVIESFTKDQLQVSGSTITIDKTVDLSLETSYAITVATGLIMAAADTTRFFDGYTSTSAWRFSTEYNSWDGSQWADGTPQPSDNVSFKADYPFAEGELLEFNAVYIPSGVTLSIENNATLKHQSDLESDGGIIIESGSSLNSQGSFTGNGGSSLTVQRNTSGGVGDGLYSFVGAPFYNYDFTTVSGNFKYSYNQSSNVYVDASGVTNMIAGRGYTLANNDYIEFVGVNPITGDISIGVQNSGEGFGYNLVSNPYTAAISYDALMAAEGPTGSGDITSTIYIWDDGGSGAKSQSDFITVNTLGSVTGGSGRNSDFNGHIGVAQGFFVESTQANTSLTFTDAMKVDGNNADANYFRTSNESYETVKIALTNSEEVRSEILVGWVLDASAAYDIKYDSRKLVGNNASQLYMPLGARNLSIQGVPLDHDEPIALAVDVKEAGNYSLSVDELSTNRALVLYDKQQDLIHNLTNSDYIFYSQQGVFRDRFELHFNAAVLSSDLLEELTIYAHGSRVNITNNSNSSKMYRMMSLSGQEVWRGEVLGHFSKDFSSLPQGVYIVTDGEQSHKIILK